MSRTNETHHIEWHKTCECKCRFEKIFCNDKQRWNSDKCRCEYKELIDKGKCDDKFIWNPSTCGCECHNSCHVGEYLDDANGKCRKRLIDKLIENVMKILMEIKWFIM